MNKVAAVSAAVAVVGSGIHQNMKDGELGDNSSVSSPKLGLRKAVESAGNSPMSSPKLGLRKAVGSVGSPLTKPKHGGVNFYHFHGSNPSLNGLQGDNKGSNDNLLHNQPGWKLQEAGQQCFMQKPRERW